MVKPTGKKKSLLSYFESKDKWINLNKLYAETEDRITLTWDKIGDPVVTRYGNTRSFIFETPEGEEARLLTNSQNFYEVCRKHLPRKSKVRVWKDENGWWVIDFAE